MLPEQGDIGPDTEAQMAGAVVLTIRESNGLVLRRKRRDHALEAMYRDGKVSGRQRDAGLAIFAAYEETRRTGEAAFTKVYVDVSPDYGADAVRRAEKSEAYGDMMAEIPKDLRGVVWHVAVMGGELRAGYSRNGAEAEGHLAELQVALDLLANFLRL